VSETEAVVTRIDGDQMWVEVKEGCSACAQSGSCGLGDGKGKPAQRMRNTIGANIGDTVVLALPDGGVLRAVLYCYLLPLVAAIALAVGGKAVAGEAGAVMGAVLGLAVGWLNLRRAGRRELDLNIQLRSKVVHLHRNQPT
jgi:sigma-E factor negative regulatory protein RseC